MQYIYNIDSGKNNLILNRDLYKYIVKVRRFRVGDNIDFRNLKDNYLYKYKIEKIDKKNIYLTLFEKILDNKHNDKEFELFWCIIEPKIIEKTLPILNQIGVSKITFIYCQRSQKNFEIDFDRLKKILINSNQQCGRVDLMKLEIVKNIDDILTYDDIYVLDFGGVREFDNKNIKRVLIGCEGGFNQNEREKLSKYIKISFNTPYILKSESATIAISSKIIL